MKQSERTNDAERAARRSIGMLMVRYGIGGILILAGLVVLLISPGGLGAHGFAMAAGAGASVLLLNLLFRMSVSGEGDREREEQARRYFDEHGEWPDEEEARRSGREWVLPVGVVTPEQEEQERRARRCPETRRCSRRGEAAGAGNQRWVDTAAPSGHWPLADRDVEAPAPARARGRRADRAEFAGGARRGRARAGRAIAGPPLHGPWTRVASDQPPRHGPNGLEWVAHTGTHRVTPIGGAQCWCDGSAASPLRVSRR